MKKHLHVLLALVAFVGLVNGLRGGASGGAGGSARKRGGLEASGPKNSSAESLNGKGSSGPSGKSSSPGATTSVLGGGAGGGTGGGTSRSRSGSTGGTAGRSASADTRASVGGSSSGGAGVATPRPTSGTGGSVTAGADSQSGGSNPAQAPSTVRAGGGGGASAAAAGGPSQAQSGGSSRSPGSSTPTSRPSSRGSSGAEHLSQGPGVGSSVESGNGRRSGRRGETLELGPLGSGTSPEGFGVSVGGAGGGPRASTDESGRLGSGLFFDGQSFGGRETGTPGFGAFGRGSSGYFESPFSDPSTGEVGGAAGGSAGGRRGRGNEELFEDETGFSGAFGTSGFSRNYETGLPTSGISNWGSGLGGDFGAGSFGTDRNGGEGGLGGSALGFGDFSGGRNTGFGGPGGAPEFGFPESPDGRPGPSAGSRDGENGPLPGLFSQPGPERLPSSDNGPVGSDGWPTRENSNDFGNSGLDSSRGLSGPADNGPLRPAHSRLFGRLWQRRRDGQGLFGLGRRLRRPDPRLAAAIAVGTLAGATALTGLGTGIAAAVLASRTRDAERLDGRRSLCVGRCRAREQRIVMGLKAAQGLLSRIPRRSGRLY